MACEWESLHGLPNWFAPEVSAFADGYPPLADYWMNLEPIADRIGIEVAV